MSILEEKRIEVIRLAEREKRKSDLGGGYALAYIGMMKRRKNHGVGLVIGPKMAKFQQDMTDVNKKLVMCTFKINGRKYSLFQVYAPQQEYAKEEKERSRNLLEQYVERQVENKIW